MLKVSDLLFPGAFGDAAKQFESESQGAESWDGKDATMRKCIVRARCSPSVD